MSLPKFESLSEIPDIIGKLPKFDTGASEAAAERQNQLTKPPGALGRLEDIAIFLAGWVGTAQPKIEMAQALVFAGNHGICDQGMNPFPQEVTAQMVANFEHGGAVINQLCQENGADLTVIALDLDTPTKDFTKGPAMSEAECLDAINTGAEAVNTDADILLLGEMGIGNSTVAAALAAGIFGGESSQWVGIGTGSNADGVALKNRVVSDGLALHGQKSPLEKLAALGGREHAAIAGAVLAARIASIPVLLDGYICTAAAAPLFGVKPELLDHCLIAHTSAEAGHKALAKAMNKTPVLNFSMRLGEGTGAALTLGIVKSALACHNGMATFAEAGVAGG